VVNAVFPGFGWVVSAVIVLGSLAFNVGNLSGCALGLEALLKVPQPAGTIVSALLAVALFIQPRILTGIDWVSKVLGAGMIGMTLYVVLRTGPPIGQAAFRAVWPEQMDVAVTVTLVGGTIGGYIMFSGAHRLLDGGVAGPEHTQTISWASIKGILITGLMRVVLFLSILGVVWSGAALGQETPVFDAFRAAAGGTGLILSGLVFWSAAITSVIGCSYTSITFLPQRIREGAPRGLIVGFILLSLALTLLLRLAGWQPTPLLIAAGTINGIFLPVLLGTVLIAAYRPQVVGHYHHPWWAGAAGILAWVATLVLAYQTVRNLFS
jgi:Mn2+/Fe2+ NRAMP family transporter